MTTGVTTTGTLTYAVPGNVYSSKEWSGADDRKHKAFNPWSVTFLSNVIPTDMQYHYVDPWNNTWVPRVPSNVGHIGWDSTFVLNSNDINASLNRLMTRVKGHAFNIAVFLGESRESIEMIHENIRTLSAAFVAFKHGKFLSAYRLLLSGRDRVMKRRVFVGQLLARVRRLRPIKDWRRFYSADLNSRFLMMEYGWFPLLADINELIKSIDADRERVRHKIFKIRSSYSKRKSGIVWASNGVFGQYRKSERSIRYTCRYTLRGYEQALGNFDFYDLANTAYQLTTLSFVLDWFLPIGAFLEAMSAEQVLNQLNTTSSRKVYDEITGYVYSDPRFRGGSKYRETRVTYSRSKGVSAQLPSWKNPLNGTFKRVADAIALFRARIR